MTIEESNADQPGGAARRIVDPYLNTVSIHDGPARFLEDFAKLPQAARHIFAVLWCDHEVCNGGLHQFFSNSTGVLAPEAVSGFRAMNLACLGELVETAMQQLGSPYPRDRGTRQDALRLLRRPGKSRDDWDPFGNLDEKYYASRDRADFDAALDLFARTYGR